METVTYKSCQDRWSDLCEKAVDSTNATVLATFNRAFQRTLRRGWEWYWWPELMRTQERFYRDAWAATSYASGDEVYDAGTAKYWRANAATIAGDVPGVSTKWDELTVVDAYIDRDQDGQTPFTHALEVFDSSPRETRSARHLPWQYDERGVVLTGPNVPASAWLRFRIRCPQFSGPTWSTGVLAAGVTRYYASATEGYEGDYWQTVTATLAGDSPEVAPTKWSRREIPVFLADFAVHGAKISYLEGDGQLEKALADTQSELWSWLYDEIDKLSPQTTPRRARYA